MNEGRRSVASATPDGPDMATRPVVVWVAGVALCFALVACGQRGPLTLPTAAASATPAHPTASPASSPTPTP